MESFRYPSVQCLRTPDLSSTILRDVISDVERARSAEGQRIADLILRAQQDTDPEEQ